MNPQTNQTLQDAKYSKIANDSEELKKEIKEHDLDKIEEIFRKGLEEGRKHSQPSPETLERLKRLEENLAKLAQIFQTHYDNGDEKLNQLIEDFKDGMKDVKRITGLLSNTSFMVKFFVGVGSTFMFLGGAYLMIRSILHGQN